MYLISLSCNANNFNNFLTLASTRLRLPEDDTDALNHVGVLTMYKKKINVYVVHLLISKI